MSPYLPTGGWKFPWRWARIPSGNEGVPVRRDVDPVFPFPGWRIDWLILCFAFWGISVWAGSPRPITLFHTNDWHGMVAPAPALWMGGNGSSDPAIEAFLASASSALAPLLERQVGRLDQPLLRGETGSGMFGPTLCAAIAAKTGIPIAVYHLGGIRGDLPAGPLRYGQVSSVLPFNHRILVGELSGKDLAAAILRGRILCGLAWTGLSVGPSGVVTDATGRPLSPEGVYRLSFNDYLAQEGDGFAEFKRAKNITTTEILVRDAFLSSLGSRMGDPNPAWVPER